MGGVVSGSASESGVGLRLIVPAITLVLPALLLIFSLPPLPVPPPRPVPPVPVELIAPREPIEELAIVVDAPATEQALAIIAPTVVETPLVPTPGPTMMATATP